MKETNSNKRKRKSSLNKTVEELNCEGENACLLTFNNQYFN